MYKNQVPTNRYSAHSPKSPQPTPRSAATAAPRSASRNDRPAASHYELLWRKKSAKVHKSWEGDGRGTVTQSNAGFDLMVERDDGFKLGVVRLGTEAASLTEGTILSAGSYEVEVGPPVTPKVQNSNSPKPDRLRSKLPGTALIGSSPVGSCPIGSAPAGSLQVRSFQARMPLLGTSIVDTSPIGLSPVKVSSASTSPIRGGLKGSCTRPVKKSKPNELEHSRRKDHGAPPSVETAGMRQGPSLGMLSKFRVPSQVTRDARPSGSGVTDSIDSNLQLKMRPHQIEGAQFMRDSVLGKRHKHGYGCILADEMGLGKTLTAIALVHTMLKNHEIKNALIVCPVTLINNWKAEFQKWLDPFSQLPVRPQVGVMTIDQNGWGSGRLKDPITAFFGDRHFRLHQVMIVGYERVRLLSSQLIQREQQFDLLICDEGHRLKASNSKTAESIDSITSEKRILLTGTPVQNDLSELWALSNFVNPGCFGNEAKFVRKFVQPISTEFNTNLDSKQRGSGETDDVDDDDDDFTFDEQISSISRTREAAESSLAELTEICDEFMLRRTSSVMEQYIQVPKTEYVIFCRPTQRQAAEYAAMVGSASSLINGMSEGTVDQGSCLQAISKLRKSASGTPRDMGGKMKLLSSLIDSIRQQTDEKMVIVSGSTRVLDMCQQLCAGKNVSWLRLDGSTPQDKRQSSVNIFNKTPNTRAFAFLLSSRSGGTGLNLIGGSRLVLMDCDWNPAIDSQVMSRIHRDGQKRSCHIYRLITTGTIEEKIFQRQISKIELSSNVLLGSSSISKSGFSLEALRDLFTMSYPEKCNTLENSTISTAIRGYKEADIELLSTNTALKDAMEEAGNVSCVLMK